MLGHSITLTIRRIGGPGAFLGGRATEPDVLLPGAELPSGTRVGDELRVFVTSDAEGRLLATTREPRIELGEVAFLEVTSCEEFGAFFEWGLPKDLFVPAREQTALLRVGQRHPIGLYVDPKGRLAGTMKVNKILERGATGFEQEEWVDGEAWRNDPEIGLFVIVERRCVGLVPASEPHPLSRGQAARFRVSNVLPNGKIELSLRGRAHEELDSDGELILALLERSPSATFGDYSSPERIRELFGLSKKAFKRALGRLLKQGKVTLDEQGNVRTTASGTRPGSRR